MKIAVLGADTELGRRIVNAAEGAGIQVASVVEHFASSIGSGPLIIKEVHELNINDFSKCHAIIDTLSFQRIEANGADKLPFWHVCNLIRHSSIKLIAVGSSAFLYTDKKRDTFVRDMDGIHFDNNEKRHNLAVEAFLKIKEIHDVEWTLLCPPLVLDLKAYGTGKFELGDDILPMSVSGSSYISLCDFCKALVELLKVGGYSCRCVGVRSL